MWRSGDGRIDPISPAAPAHHDHAPADVVADPHHHPQPVNCAPVGRRGSGQRAPETSTRRRAINPPRRPAFRLLPAS
jgi:hypothetical protein